MKQNLSCRPTQAAASTALTCLFAAALVMVSALAVAQERAPAAGAQTGGSFFDKVGRWFEEQADKIKSTFRDTNKNIANFGHAAGIAARATVDNAKTAAGAVARIPNARVISGHEKCMNAPNGAPDCVAAAAAICKAKGFATGKSVDMTTAEVCPAQVYLSGRSSGPGCKTETFVSRVLCQ